MPLFVVTKNKVGGLDGYDVFTDVIPIVIVANDRNEAITKFINDMNGDDISKQRRGILTAKFNFDLSQTCKQTGKIQLDYNVYTQQLEEFIKSYGSIDKETFLKYNKETIGSDMVETPRQIDTYEFTEAAQL